MNWREEKGDLRSGLHLAVNEEHEEVVDLLLSQSGVEVNMADKYKRTALMVACRLGLDNMVRKLLRVDGVGLNCRSVDGRTALHYAVWENNPVCVEVLREQPELYCDCSVVAMAAAWGRADCLEVILSLPELCLDKEVAWLAVRNTSRGDPVRSVRLLSEDGRVDWNAKDSAGDTPLFYCLKKGQIEMAKILLSNPGVDHDLMDGEGKYLENIARERNLREILDLKWGGVRASARRSRCPVCLEQLSTNSQVHQCQDGHFVCGNCRPSVKACPTCRGRLMGRAHGFEEHLKNLNL